MVRHHDHNLLRQLRAGLRAEVDVDQRDARLGGGVGDRLGRGRIGGVDDDRIDAAGDEVLHLAQLLADVALGILDLQVDLADLAGPGLHGVRDLDQELVGGARHRDADVERLGQNWGRETVVSARRPRRVAKLRVI